MWQIWWDCIRRPVAPGVFSSLSHFKRSSGAIPPRAPYRWAHVWRNEPRAITRCLCGGVQRRLPVFCLPLSAPPPLLLISVPSPPQHLSLSPLPLHASLLPPTRGGHVLGLQSLHGGGRGTRWEAWRNKLTETPQPISGLCYRKIYPFMLHHADGGRGLCFGV